MLIVSEIIFKKCLNKARKYYHSFAQGVELSNEQVSNELDGDTMKGLDPYLRIDAAAFACLHTQYGSQKTREHINSLMPSAAAVPHSIDHVVTQVKLWRDLQANVWLGETARTDCNIVLEALEAMKSHDVAATRKMTAQWPKSIAEQLAFFCRFNQKADKKTGAKELSLNGRAAAQHLLNEAATADADGETDSASVKALLPFQFLLAPDEVKRFLVLRSKNNLVTGSASASGSSIAAKKVKLGEAIDPHAATWSLFRAA